MNQASENPGRRILERLKRPVAVWGRGRSGRGAHCLLAARGIEVIIYDANDPLADRSTFGPEEAAGHDLVVFSPGFTTDHPWFEAAAAAGCQTLGELDLAALFWRGPILAITGTNGKTTLTELLTYALGLAGRSAAAVGNIGIPFTRMAACVTDESTIAVCEVSSFQAETRSLISPDWTLWTNFAEDHLERHGSLRAYFQAKYELVRATRPGQTLFGPSVLAFSQDHELELDPSGLVERVPPGMEELADGTAFASGPQWENFVLAAHWWRRQSLPDEFLRQAVVEFRLGRHRLERVATHGGVDYWNDSKATNFHAAEAALSTFAAPVIWIGGGKSKGGDLAEFARRIAPRIRCAVLIGETAPHLAPCLRGAGVSVHLVSGLEEAVRICFNQGHPGDSVLLSPAFSSFDMFDGYEDRGEQFAAAVQRLLPQALSC